ncbi:MAG: YdcF family protein [Thiolinea sp.]
MKKKLFLLFVLLYALTILGIWSDGVLTGYAPSEYAVVLGNQVYANGEPSKRLQERLNRAFELHRAGIVQKIIVSGGIGIEQQDEARVMKAFLVAKGIPEFLVIVDSNGYDTRMTAQNADQWLLDKQAPLIVVSQLYHLSRSKMAFEQLGYTQVGVAYPSYFEGSDMYASLREVLAWVSYKLGIK